MGENEKKKWSSEEILYGVSSTNGEWFVNGATGIIFHTSNLKLARAQARAMGSEYQVYVIGDDGKREPIR
jgi:hypothetical protein